jgi:menaquinol-cytochrome c reductase iron-sulfur subunit
MSETPPEGADPVPVPAPASERAHGAAHEPPKEIPPELVARRRFLARVSVGLGAVGGAALTAPLVGFVVAPLAREVPRTFRSVGKLSDFKIGETVLVTFVDTSPLPWAGVTANTGAWLRRVSETKFRAFAINCAHLGCPVKWLPDARLFMCPCHGGVYYEDGSVAAGPPPHPLSQYIVRVEGEDVQIRTEPIPME